MKKNILIMMVLAFAVSFASCNSKTEKTATVNATSNEDVVIASTQNNGHTSIKNMDKTAERTQMIKKRREELEKMTPLDKTRFESWIPETLDDLKRTSFEFKLSPVMGEVAYMNEANGKNIEISFFDGAGEDGAFRFAHEANYTGLEKDGFEEKTDYETYQVRKRDGEYSSEHYYKSGENSKIKTILEDRYLVSASGYKMSTDELWKYIESMNFKDLK